MKTTAYGLGAMEAFWLAVVFAGNVMHILAMIESRSDYKRGRSGSPETKFMTKIIWQSTFYTQAIHMEFLIAAMWGIFINPPPYSYIIGRIFSSSMLTALSIAGHFWRKRLSEGRYNGDHGERRKPTTSISVPTVVVAGTDVPGAVRAVADALEANDPARAGKAAPGDGNRPSASDGGDGGTSAAGKL